MTFISNASIESHNFDKYNKAIEIIKLIDPDLWELIWTVRETHPVDPFIITSVIKCLYRLSRLGLGSGYGKALIHLADDTVSMITGEVSMKIDRPLTSSPTVDI